MPFLSPSPAKILYHDCIPKCRTKRRLHCLAESNVAALRCKWKWEFVFSLLSFFLPVLISLAPVSVPFCSNLSPSPCFCLSYILEGIALGHSVSLFLLSALSTPLQHSSHFRGCWFKLLFSVYQLLLQHYHRLCQISGSYADNCSKLWADKATELLWEALVWLSSTNTT